MVGVWMNIWMRNFGIQWNMDSRIGTGIQERVGDLIEILFWRNLGNIWIGWWYRGEIGWYYWKCFNKKFANEGWREVFEKHSGGSFVKANDGVRNIGFASEYISLEVATSCPLDIFLNLAGDASMRRDDVLTQWFFWMYSKLCFHGCTGRRVVNVAENGLAHYANGHGPYPLRTYWSILVHAWLCVYISYGVVDEDWRLLKISGVGCFKGGIWLAGSLRWPMLRFGDDWTNWYMVWNMISYCPCRDLIGQGISE